MSRFAMPENGRTVALAVYLPTFVFSLGQGAIMPVIAALAVKLGASLAVSSLVAGAWMVGQLIGDIPSGSMVSRFGERQSMLTSAIVSVGSVITCLLAPNWIVLGIGVVVLGVSGSTFTLARHTYMTVSIPIDSRARALSMLGGVSRLGQFAGPGVATLFIFEFGVQSVFFVHAAACLIVIVLLLVLPDPEDAHDRPDPVQAKDGDYSTSVRANIGMLVRLGGSISVLSAVRASKTVMIPLWALHVGISAAHSTEIVWISAGAELILFYASGQVMDYWGRLGSVLPCLGGLVLGHVFLPFTHSFATLLADSVLLGLVNGIGSGINLTIGSDIAPQVAPARVLGAWRLFGDAGSATTPMLISALIAVGSLALATLTVAGIGAVGLALLLRYVPRYVTRSHRARIISLAATDGTAISEKAQL